MAKQETIPKKLLWIDLEMTGLDPTRDVILEAAVEITDFEFKTLESYDVRIAQKRETVVARMQANTWWQDFPENRDDFLNHLDDGKPLAVVEQELIDLTERHFGKELAILAGNSIHSDKMFIKHWLPHFDLRLHYRLLDVSSFKIVMQGRYGEIFEKDAPHRAFDDIQASIAELQYYLEWFKRHE